MQVNAVLGAKDDLRYLQGGIGWVGGQLEAEQGQGQGHFQLVHGKLLPDAVPGIKQLSSASRYSKHPGDVSRGDRGEGPLAQTPLG